LAGEIDGTIQVAHGAGLFESHLEPDCEVG